VPIWSADVENRSFATKRPRLAIFSNRHSRTRLSVSAWDFAVSRRVGSAVQVNNKPPLKRLLRKLLATQRVRETTCGRCAAKTAVMIGKSVVP
jgi:hypothetical protein